MNRGLSQREAEERLRRFGPNVLPEPKGRPWWKLLLRQLVYFFAAMLWVAAGLALLAGLLALAVAIVVVIIVNGLFAFVQEYRADRATQKLRRLLPRRATVVRDGRQVSIDASELVVEDLVLLNTGDRVSADLKVLEAHDLAVDMSALTGESVPVPQKVGSTLYAGTFVVQGEGAAEVIATGEATRLAGIAHLVSAEQRPESPLALELRHMVRIIAAIALGIGGAFFATSLVLGIQATQSFIFALGVVVALVPEALLPTLTLSLALGAYQMSRRNALVRRLESVETLGSTTFLCIDKTGTLTLNEMMVVEAWVPGGWARIHGSGYEPVGTVETSALEVRPALEKMAWAAARCATGQVVLREGRWVAQGDPMEAALDVLARRLNIPLEEDRARMPAERRFPFDARRRRMAVVVAGQVLVKGAPEAVLPLCGGVGGAQDALEAMAARGLRVLAVASRALAEEEVRTPEQAEQNLTLLGLLGLEDPPRKEASDTIAACRRAGIKVAMVTGDHPATACAIAREVGLLCAPARVVTGPELPRDDEALGRLMDHDGLVVARVEPEDKMRIAKSLHRRGHVVAITGDGVNDGPALQAADIGVAMGSRGTDVAREAADLVLLDDDIATLVVAIELGRATYANVRRFLTYHLTDNVAEVTPWIVWALSVGAIPLALSVLQILALDIGTDTFSAVALGAEPARASQLSEPPRRGHLLDKRVAVRVFGVLGPVEASAAMAAFIVSLLAEGWRPGLSLPPDPALRSASGAAFAAIVVGQTANAFACRSMTRWPGALGWFSNRLLVVAASVELVLAAGFLFVRPIAEALGHAPPTPVGRAVALTAGPAVLLADALYKALGPNRRPSGERR